MAKVQRNTKTITVRVTRVRGGSRMMWYTAREKASSSFVQALEQIGATAEVVEAAKR